jgi:hypothetical protein
VNSRKLGFSNTADTGTGLFGNNTWLGRYATLYDRFRIHSIKLFFEPTLALTHSGQCAMYCDPDFDPALPTTYLQMSANDGVRAKQIGWDMNLTYTANHFNRLNWYDTTQGVSATGTAGNIIVATSTIASPVPAFAGPYTCGFLWMEYDIEFSLPSNPATATSPPATFAAAQQSQNLNLGQVKESIASTILTNPELQGVGSSLVAALTSYMAANAAKRRGRKSPDPYDAPSYGETIPSTPVEPLAPTQSGHDEL